MKSKKQKKGKNSKRPVRRLKINEDLDEHIVKLIEESLGKKEIKQSIDAVVKKEKPKKSKTKSKKSKTASKGKTKDIYGQGSKGDEYKSLQGAGVYDQVKFSPFVGFLYKSNIKENKEFYDHLNKSPELKMGDDLGERNLVSSEIMKNYAAKTSLNFLIGEGLMGIGGMNSISVEEKELMNFNLYDRIQKAVYLAEITLLGFGTDKTMHAPVNG